MNRPTGLQPKEINHISLSWYFILPHLIYSEKKEHERQTAFMNNKILNLILKKKAFDNQ